MKVEHFLYAFLVILLAACSSPERKLLKQADSVIIDHPDSAMVILKSIDRNRLGETDLPYYALLFTQAQVETGIRLSSDSLIRIAYDKYRNDKRGDKGIRSIFYLGESYFNQYDSYDVRTIYVGDEQSFIAVRTALKCYLIAYEEAKRQSNDYWHARTAKRIKLNFCWINNYYEGERYAREVVEHFNKAGKEQDYRIAIIDHATLYGPMKKFDIEREILDSLRAVLVNEVQPDSFLINRIDSELWEMDQDITDLKKQGYYFLTEEDMKDVIAKSAHGYMWLPSLPDSVERPKRWLFPGKGRRNLEMEVTEARRDFYDDVSRQNAENAALFQKILWISVVVFIAIIFILTRMFYFRYKAQKARMASDLESFLSLKAASDRIAEESVDTISHLKQELEERDRRESSYNRIVKDLLAEKWSTLGMLCDQLFDVGQTDLERKRVVRNIEKELKKIVSPQGVGETVEALDKHMGGLISRLRQQCPFLKEEDINFLGLIYAGFSVRAVCMFTGMEYQHFYVKKSRLLKRIQNSDAPDKEIFIGQMQRK